jgi:hypothetical protein
MKEKEKQPKQEKGGDKRPQQQQHQSFNSSMIKT